MSKHTPGPWVNRGPRSLHGDYQIWSRSYPDVARVSNEHDEETQANARLIAAAPELLEVLKECAGVLSKVMVLNESPLGKRILKQARAVVAKAEGETNE